MLDAVDGTVPCCSEQQFNDVSRRDWPEESELATDRRSCELWGRYTSGSVANASDFLCRRKSDGVYRLIDISGSWSVTTP